MQHDGSVIGSKTIGEETVGNGEGDADGNDKRCSSEEILLATAIEAGSLWENYSQITTQIRGGNEQRLRCLIVECEGRKLCIAEVSRLLLCIVAKPSVGLGLLRSKAALLASHFVGTTLRESIIFEEPLIA
eukprot:gene3396-5316_t